MSGIDEDKMDTSAAEVLPVDKGKGKVLGSAQDPRDEGDSSASEGEDNAGEPELEEETYEEIDTSNIIQGGRTRGKQIDYTKVDASDLPPEEDEEEDDDFNDPEQEETAEKSDVDMGGN